MDERRHELIERRLVALIERYPELASRMLAHSIRCKRCQFCFRRAVQATQRGDVEARSKYLNIMTRCYERRHRL